MAPTPASRELLDTVARLAIDALTSMVGLRIDEHAAAMHRLVDEFGTHLAIAMQCWCDYALAVTKRHVIDPAMRADLLTEACTVFPEDGDEHHTWATRMMRAAIYRDLGAFSDGITELNTLAAVDGYRGYARMHTLLSLCAALVASATLTPSHHD